MSKWLFLNETIQKAMDFIYSQGVQEDSAKQSLLTLYEKAMPYFKNWRTRWQDWRFEESNEDVK